MAIRLAVVDLRQAIYQEQSSKMGAYYNKHSGKALKTKITIMEKVITDYSNISHIRNSIFYLRPKNVSYSTRVSGNEGQCFLYEGCKLITFHMSLQCLITQGK